MTPKQQIRQTIRKSFGKDLRSASVTKGVRGYLVVVAFNGHENFTNKMIRGGIEDSMSSAYQAVYTSSVGRRVDVMTTVAYLPLVDKYGNNFTAPVYRTTLDRETARRINWTAPGLDWSNLWRVSLLHPAIQ